MEAASQWAIHLFDDKSRYQQVQHAEVHGVTITDSIHRYESSPPDELIWVGVYGEGRWLKPEEVLELAAALEVTAHAHIERISREQRRIFAINH